MLRPNKFEIRKKWESFERVEKKNPKCHEIEPLISSMQVFK
jgi:hypothetical protein